MLLELDNLHVRYGRTEAVNGVSLKQKEGEIVAVLGANGAGKSSLLKALAGIVTPASGTIRYDGEDITKLRVDQRIDRGIVLVPEGRRILISLTVEENLQLGAHQRADRSGLNDEIAAIYDQFSNLKERRHMEASCLSGGEQQMLAIGRAMLAKPRLMMLDEPSLGLSPLLVQQVFSLISELNTGGLSILLIEQNTSMALSVANHALLFELGRTVMAGTAEELTKDDVLRQAYLGG
ncbi:ABC transporter ATP-binding protein [Alphaproteobacteria bacterium KMM 3653]|uniref:ABC transporter ATP-binding protein n=1 Tax=Harenicola maris TaxID=2841044 RepID=A0AAP2G7F3_9RHOB|nr:ABC transporter ATP-binding protein [Harenicola maris]